MSVLQQFAMQEKSGLITFIAYHDTYIMIFIVQMYP